MKTTSSLLYIIVACVFSLIFVVNIAQCDQGGLMDSFQVFAVGKVKKDSGITTIEIYKEYADALLGLDRFSHVIVLYWFHKNDTPEKRSVLRVHPRHNMSNPLTGVFACHSPCRPNLIGLSVCKILSIKGNVIRIDSIDAFNDSPVIDLKSYMPSMGSTQNTFVPKWATRPHSSHPKKKFHPSEIIKQLNR